MTQCTNKSIYRMSEMLSAVVPSTKEERAATQKEVDQLDRIAWTNTEKTMRRLEKK